MREFSKNRAQLLRLFYTNPDRAFYIQEIGRILGKKPGVFQRMLNNLEREGILTSEYKANIRYFRANKNYPLFKELKSIVFKTVGVIGSIRKALKKVGQVDFAFLYGSFAQGKESNLSDIDLVIIGNPEEDEVIQELEKLEKLLKREINYKLYTLQEFEKEIKRKNAFLLKILRDKKIMLIGEVDELRTIFEGSSC
jgi:predicted nucleotidyltransferase